MKQLFSALRQVRRELNIVFLVSVVLVLLIEFHWKHQPALFGWEDAHEGAELAKDFLLSIIASYIFFFIGDHWERSEHRNRLEPVVLRKMTPIIQSYARLMETIWKGIKARNSNGYSEKNTKNVIKYDEQDWLELYIYCNIPNAQHPKADIVNIKDKWREFLTPTLREARSIIADHSAFDAEMMGDLENLLLHCNDVTVILDSWPVETGPDFPEGMAIRRLSESTIEINKLMGTLLSRIRRSRSEMPWEVRFDMWTADSLLQFEGTMEKYGAKGKKREGEE